MIFSRRHFVAGASSLVLAGNGIVPSLAGQKEKKESNYCDDARRHGWTYCHPLCW